MNHLTFLTLAINLVDKASDGHLSFEEIQECAADAFPEFYGQISAAVDEAMADGKITVWEVLRILTRVID